MLIQIRLSNEQAFWPSPPYTRKCEIILISRKEKKKKKKKLREIENLTYLLIEATALKAGPIPKNVDHTLCKTELTAL